MDKNTIVAFLKNLREEILLSFESLEQGARFEKKPWQHKSGGGGEMGILRGKIFEKAAVNFSAVSGDHFPMKDGSGPFFATGVSLITHMNSPHAPTVHMNVRYIESGDTFWFGGGYDLTPMGIYYQEDEEHFHSVAKAALDSLNPQFYPLFYQNAKEYFYIPHRQKERGVGGIFFDHIHTGNKQEDFALIQTVGNSFLPAILPIYEKRAKMPFIEKEKERQLELRAHYAEFNLVYDRGTKFGFLSGGNVEAILSSMPPLVKW